MMSPKFIQDLSAEVEREISLYQSSLVEFDASPESPIRYSAGAAPLLVELLSSNIVIPFVVSFVAGVASTLLVDYYTARPHVASRDELARLVKNIEGTLSKQSKLLQKHSLLDDVIAKNRERIYILLYERGLTRRQATKVTEEIIKCVRTKVDLTSS